MSQPCIETLGDAALLLRFGDSIDPDTNARVLACRDQLRRERWPGILDLVPAYATLGVLYDPLVWEADALRQRLLSLRWERVEALSQRALIEIPVCYAALFAPDRDEVCAHAGLAAEEIARLHSTAEYRVYFLGFMPGFPYLGGLHPRLHIPRRATPRQAVAPGSVAIAGEQTGVYPRYSPGGWRIIGRTPLRLFEPQREPACLLKAGDRVRFVPITVDEFHARNGGDSA